ncbi:MAG TPA: response regulator [Terriglobia bacterium]|jgi:pilus assembly protein CpaE|nr:response regulator [Terriglobia bacterium]
MLTAAVAGADAKSSGYLTAYLQQTGMVRTVAQWTLAADQWPGPGESVPDVVILDLGRDTESGFEFAGRLRRLRPTVGIIACSSFQQPSPGLLMQAMRCGVREFLAHPVDLANLQDILKRFVQELGPKASEGDQKLIVALGSKGGVGTTTVAVNLAVQLKQLTKKRVILLDYSRPFGHVSLMLDLKARFSIRDAAENLDRLDGHFFNGLLAHHNSGLEVLAGASDVETWERIPVSTATRIASLAQGVSDFVLLDLGSQYSPEWSLIFHQARAVLVVAVADVAALWTLERHLLAMSSLGLDPEQLRIVINRWHRGDEEALKVFEKKMKSPIFARIPNDFRQVSEANNLGTPLSRNHGDPLLAKLRHIAAQLGHVPLAEGAKRGTLFNLFSSPSLR